MSFDERDTLKEEDIRKDLSGKGDGKPYLDWLNEEYSKMSEEERKEVDAYGEMLRKKLDLIDKDDTN